MLGGTLVIVDHNLSNPALLRYVHYEDLPTFPSGFKPMQSFEIHRFYSPDSGGSVINGRRATYLSSTRLDVILEYIASHFTFTFFSAMGTSFIYRNLCTEWSMDSKMVNKV